MCSFTNFCSILLSFSFVGTETYATSIKGSAELKSGSLLVWPVNTYLSGKNDGLCDLVKASATGSKFSCTDLSVQAPLLPGKTKLLESKSDINSNDDLMDFTLSARSPSPIRAAQQGIDIAESAKNYKFDGSHGAVILQGVGQRWKAQQKNAERGAQSAIADHLVEGHIIHESVNDFRRSGSMRVRRGMWLDIKRAQNAREQLYAQYEVARSIERSRGQDIEHLGMINKDMRARMQKFFLPLPNRNRERDRALAEQARNRELIRELRGKRAGAYRGRRDQSEAARDGRGVGRPTGSQGAGDGQRDQKNGGRGARGAGRKGGGRPAGNRGGGTEQGMQRDGRDGGRGARRGGKGEAGGRGGGGRGTEPGRRGRP